LGTVCIYDTKPRRLSAIKRNALMLFSKQVTRLLTLRKKNMQLRQRAEEMISFKTEIFGRFIQRQEADKKEIAFNLHENFAQGIAAVLMILQLAKKHTPPGSDLISSAILQLKEIVVNMRNLSYAITPSIPDWMEGGELLLEFIEKIAGTYPFKIAVKSTGELTKGAADTTLCAIRIIDQWLKVLGTKNDISHVQIHVEYAAQFVLSIQDDGAPESMTDRKKEVFENIVYDRARALGGTVKLSYTAAGKNLLKVLLPLTKQPAGLISPV
jgi:signal transduction histidine kinase